MGMNKRARRRSAVGYSHTEPIYKHERDPVTERITKTEIVGYVDLNGGGRAMSARQCTVYEVKTPKPPRPERRDDDTEE